MNILLLVIAFIVIGVLYYFYNSSPEIAPQKTYLAALVRTATSTETIIDLTTLSKSVPGTYVFQSGGTYTVKIVQLYEDSQISVTIDKTGSGPIARSVNSTLFLKDLYIESGAVLTVKCTSVTAQSSNAIASVAVVS